MKYISAYWDVFFSDVYSTTVKVERDVFGPAAMWWPALQIIIIVHDNGGDMPLLSDRIWLQWKKCRINAWNIGCIACKL
jgi:hypothetical protein